MAVPASTIARLRRMVNEPEPTTYDDETLASEYIEKYPLRDSSGYEPDDTDWTPTYDLNAAAADIWEEKAAAVAYEFDFVTQGDGQLARTGKFSHASKQAAKFRSRRVAVAREIVVEPQPGDEEDNVFNV